MRLSGCRVTRSTRTGVGAKRRDMEELLFSHDKKGSRTFCEGKHLLGARGGRKQMVFLAETIAGGVVGVIVVTFSNGLRRIRLSQSEKAGSMVCHCADSSPSRQIRGSMRLEQ